MLLDFFLSCLDAGCSRAGCAMLRCVFHRGGLDCISLFHLLGFQSRNYICPRAEKVSSTSSWVSERNVFFASLRDLICSWWAQSNSLPSSQSTVNWKLHWVVSTQIRSHSLAGICVRLVCVRVSVRSLEVWLCNLGDNMARLASDVLIQRDPPWYFPCKHIQTICGW